MLILLTLLAVALIVVGTTRWKIHPFLMLLAASLLVGVGSGMGVPKLVESMQEGFGKTLGNIGIVILFGVIIGTFLENTGGAYRLADNVLRLIGQKRVHTVMAYMGFIISIPVFCDSGFVILNSLNKALSKRAGVSIAATATALAMGLITSHVLVPPTPGPIAAAGILQANLGLVILWGIIIGAAALPVIIFFTKRISLQPDIEVKTENPVNEASYEQLVANAPSFGKSLAPILLPLLLIMLKSLNEVLPFATGSAKSVVDFLGTPIMALGVGLLCAGALPKSRKGLFSESGWVCKSLAGAASIVFITGAGGVFGKVLQNAGIANYLGAWLSAYPVGILLPFLLAAALKTAQGSSTVAMITAASIVAPLMASLGVQTEMQKVWFTLAIGAGSLVVSHVNDSFFWVTTQFSGLSTSQGYRTITIASLLLGCTCMLLIGLFSKIIA